MRTRHLQLAIGIGAALAVHPALAIEGRYLGTVNRVQGIDGGDAMRHLYEIGGRQPLPRGLDLHLRASLQYQSLLPVRETDLLRSRVFADLRATRWRADAQLAPWQRNVAGNRSSRERQSQLGLHWTPRRGPQVDAGYNRLDREIAGLRSSSEDRQLRAGWGRNGYGVNAGVRRIDARANGAIGAPQRTDEFRGGVHAERSWTKLTTTGQYDGLVAKYQSFARRRSTQTQTLQGQAAWTPERRVSASANVIERWGRADDNAAPSNQRIGERDLTADLSVRPFTGLDLRAVREYRRQGDGVSNHVSDYMQLEMLYRHDVWRAVVLQTGWMSAVQFAGAGGDAPRSTAYGSLDGRLRPGLEARAEVRAARIRAASSVGTQWHELAEVRTRPTAATRINVSWRQDELPDVEGLGQQDREWQVTGSFDPSASTSVSGTWRRLSGQGRVRRAEHHTGLNANWRLTPRMVAAANGLWRQVSGKADVGSERVFGFDLGFELPNGTRLRGNARETQSTGLVDRRSYSVTVEKTF